MPTGSIFLIEHVPIAACAESYNVYLLEKLNDSTSVPDPDTSTVKYPPYSTPVDCNDLVLVVEAGSISNLVLPILFISNPNAYARPAPIAA